MYVAPPSIPSLINEPIMARSVYNVDWRWRRRYTVDTGYRGCDHGFYSGEVVTYNVISGFLGQLIDGNRYL